MSGDLHCGLCGRPIPRTSISRACVPCQRKELAWRANPKNFEGARWRWDGERYVPIQMAYGTMQTNHIAHSAKAAWESFERATRSTREELNAQGYRVKRITIAPAWGKDRPEPEQTTDRNGS